MQPSSATADSVRTALAADAAVANRALSQRAASDRDKLEARLALRKEQLAAKRRHAEALLKL
eukprot:SAG31_NODE_562_length_14085_cov_164.582869_5_plen_62_part_00